MSEGPAAARLAPTAAPHADSEPDDAGAGQGRAASRTIAGVTLDSFHADGFLPAIPLLDADEQTRLGSLDIEDDAIRPVNVAKQLWVREALVCDVARKPRIREVLTELFGAEDFYLWGAQLLDRTVGQAHPWHCDLETWREDGGFISLWLGISGTTADSSLHAIAGSHRAPRPVQADWPFGHAARAEAEPAELLGAIRETVPGARAERIGCTDGEGIFFDGRIWHGTFNASAAPRRALLLQYGRTGIPARRMKDIRAWPPHYDTQHPPLVLTVAGEPDPVSNKHVRQGANGSPAHMPASVRARPALDMKDGGHWTVHPYFRLETPVMSRISCHASVLAPGHMPHMPHTHDDEEILVALGEGPMVFLPSGKDGTLRAVRMKAGDMFYYPAGLRHTIFNAGGEDVRYLMFRWTARRAETQPAKPFAARSANYRESGLAVDAPSSRLDHLHIHFTRLEPGRQLPRHIDRYDSAFLVLKGELSSLGRALGPGGVFFNRAGELHDTGNQGTEPCEYLVFEFHAMAG